MKKYNNGYTHKIRKIVEMRKIKKYVSKTKTYERKTKDENSPLLAAAG